MAEATLAAPTISFSWPNWRTRPLPDTFDREESPREVTKDGLRREMLDAYRGYRQARAAMPPKAEELSTNFASADTTAFETMLRSIESAFQEQELTEAPFELVHDKLTTWLIGALRDYETRWQDALPSNLTEAINDIKALGYHWDGRAALPVSPQAIATAQTLLAQFGANAKMFEPFADPDGSLGLEAHKGQKSLYVVASPEGTFAYVLRDGQTVHRGSKVDLENMRRISSALF